MQLWRRMDNHTIRLSSQKCPRHLTLSKAFHHLQRKEKRIEQVTEKHLQTLLNAKSSTFFLEGSLLIAFLACFQGSTLELTFPFNSVVGVSRKSHAERYRAHRAMHESFEQLSNHFPDERKRSPPQKFSSFFFSLA